MLIKFSLAGQNSVRDLLDSFTVLLMIAQAISLNHDSAAAAALERGMTSDNNVSVERVVSQRFIVYQIASALDFLIGAPVAILLLQVLLLLFTAVLHNLDPLFNIVDILEEEVRAMLLNHVVLQLLLIDEE